MTDVLIIGSGPAGMSAAIYAKRANLNVLIVEKNMKEPVRWQRAAALTTIPVFTESTVMN